MAHLIGYLAKRPRAAVIVVCPFPVRAFKFGERQMHMTDVGNEIAENDILRRAVVGGCVEISHDVASSDAIESILDGVRNYDCFAEHKNEHEDHSFGLINFDEGWIFWEISKCEKSGPRDCKCTMKKVLKI
ncbi:MAG: hypothetical protein CFE32_15535, partial [Alphaproteobacteria bacterium PA3]